MYKNYMAKFYQNNIFLYTVSMLVAIVLIGLNFVITWLMQQILDAISNVPDFLYLLNLAIMTVANILLLTLFKMTDAHVRPRFLKKAMLQFKNYALENLLKKKLTKLHGYNTSSFLAGFSNDMNVIETDYLKSQFDIVVNMVALVIAVIMMVMYNPVMAVIAVLFSFLPILAVVFSGNKMEYYQKQVSLKHASFLATLKDILHGFAVIKSLGAEQEMMQVITKESEEEELVKCQREKLDSFLDMFVSIASVTAQLGTFLSGAVLSLSGNLITTGQLVAFLELTGFFVVGIQTLPVLMVKRKAALGLVDKLIQMLESDNEEQGETFENSLQYGIEVSKVSFSYEQEQPVFKHITYIF